MSHQLTIKKGLDLKIGGSVSDFKASQTVAVSVVAIIPDDFPGFVPKVEVKEGEAVVPGTPLLRDKHDESIKLVSPVAGTVKAIVRGERRKIERVVVEVSTDAAKAEGKSPRLESNEEIREMLKRSGLWAMMRQRPYDIVPEGNSEPRDIFVTAIDSAPLAVNYTAQVAKYKDELAAAVKLLAKLTSGKVYVSRRADSGLDDIPGAEMVDVMGPHPAGNIGTQIANLAPVNKGETVWGLDLVTLWRIGVTALTGNTPWTAEVALTGTEIEHPAIVATHVGASIKELLAGRIKDDGRHHRIISGNVLTGVKVSDDGFLHYPYRQVTVIPEGDDVDEFMGWASLAPSKMSTSRSFPGRFFGKIFNPDARLNGGRRALIMSGEYDRYMPMDIMGEYLLKAILGRDIEQMEKLGIYEVAPEDFALGEFADTSKIEAQRIVREGLDYLRKELE